MSRIKDYYHDEITAMYVSPYISRATQRANRNSILARIEHRPEHYTFQRSQRLYTPPLQKSRPLESYLGLITIALLGCFGLVGLMLTVSVVSDYLRGVAL